METNETLIEQQMKAAQNGAAKPAAPDPVKQPAKPAATAMQDLLATGTHTNTEPFKEATQPTQGTQPTPGPSGFAPQGNTGATTAGKLIGGDLAVNLMDLLVPSLIVFVTGKIGYLLIKKDLQLNAREKEALQPAMQAMLDRLVIDLNNPYANFALVFGVVYGSKLMDILPKAEKIEKPKEKADELADKVIESVETVKEIESDPDLDAKQKFEKELTHLIKKDKKSSKRTDAYILNKFQKDGTVDRLRKKYGL